MNRGSVFLLSLLLVFCLPAQAQTAVTGLVRDKISKEPLPGAYVLAKNSLMRPFF